MVREMEETFLEHGLDGLETRRAQGVKPIDAHPPLAASVPSMPAARSLATVRATGPAAHSQRTQSAMASSGARQREADAHEPHVFGTGALRSNDQEVTVERKRPRLGLFGLSEASWGWRLTRQPPVLRG